MYLLFALLTLFFVTLVKFFFRYRILVRRMKIFTYINESAGFVASATSACCLRPKSELSSVAVTA